MVYSVFSLNGTWEMNYCEDAYLGTENPWGEGNTDFDMRKGVIEKAVPGYWEDMTDSFSLVPFYNFLRINPEYGIQKYPISNYVPDMALPNIVGNFFYKRTFCCENITAPSVLHFDGVQNAVSVWINDVFLGRHEGYSTPFDMEIPDGLLKDGENTVVLSVSNHRLMGYDDCPVTGLTSRAANECTGGITGDVELRVYNCPLRDVALTVAEDCGLVDVNVQSVSQVDFEWEVVDNNKVLKNGKSNGDFTFDTEGLELWSPENPKLYTLNISCGDGSISRKFGVRRLLADGPHFRLNGIPYYLRGICEHCYFPETIHPAHDLAYYRSIVKSVKKLGFNFIRFHTYIPEEEYMQAADELGVLLHVESPNNTSLAEWKKIVNFCRRHTSVVIYCCGNELQIDDKFMEHLNKCADEVHKNTDSLFSPMSAMRGLEYCLLPEDSHEIVKEPFEHIPRRIKTVGKFSDMYSSYATSFHSYKSLDCDPEAMDDRSVIYEHKPRVSHEICIDGTYTDLSLKNRYEGTRVGKTEMFSSIENHLKSKGVLEKAPVYFRNSSEWQRRVRKYCFEAVRRSENIAGYDFLGPIDTHWHTFGYDVGMMNEFYELKPGETVRNVKMYNSETVLLTDLGRKTNFVSGEKLNCGIYTSCYNKGVLKNASLDILLSLDNKVLQRKNVQVDEVLNGKVSKLYDLSVEMPCVEKPAEVKLYVTLNCGELFAENEWELYVFPNVEVPDNKDLIVSDDMDADQLVKMLKDGRDVLLIGTGPFQSLPTTFRIALAGRPSGNLATVISDHPIFNDLPHDGFCGWQFGELLEGGNAVCFESDEVPFNPIVDVASVHKYAIRQSALFEFNVFDGRLLVCSFNFKDKDPGAKWLKAKLVSYAQSEDFNPKDTLDEKQLYALINGKVKKAVANSNFAFNPNDKTSKRKKN